MTDSQNTDKIQRKNSQSRAALFASFDALKFCKEEHETAEKASENEDCPEKYNGPEFDIMIS